MRFVKEEYDLRFFRISCFRETFKQFGHQKKQERCIQRLVLYQLHTVQNVDVSPAVFIGLDPIENINCRLAKKQIASRVLQHQQCALNSAKALCGHISVLNGVV